MKSGSNFNFVVMHAIFPPNYNSKIFRIDKKTLFATLGQTSYRERPGLSKGAGHVPERHAFSLKSKASQREAEPLIEMQGFSHRERACHKEAGPLIKKQGLSNTEVRIYHGKVMALSQRGLAFPGRLVGFPVLSDRPSF